MFTKDILLSRWRYLSLPEDEWSKDHFSWATGGFVATHVLKTKDNLSIPGIKAEVEACIELAGMGKQILRLPENILGLIDNIIIDGKKYREILKFKPGETRPRGYPDAYFDGQTWDFKKPSYDNMDSLRQLLKNGRKADNVVFIADNVRHVERVTYAVERERGSRIGQSLLELPNTYCLFQSELLEVWRK